MKTFKEFISEEAPKWHHDMTAREALDKAHITKAQLKTIGKHKSYQTYHSDYTGHDTPKFDAEENKWHVQTIHVNSKNVHSQWHISRKGKYFSHHVFIKEPDPHSLTGTRYTKIKSHSIDDDKKE